VLRDVRDGIVSAAGAERDYAVAISADGRGIDTARTASLRRQPAPGALSGSTARTT
jgi:hypothetical protein